MDEIGKLLEHLGYGTSVIYAAAKYGLFAWLDNNISDEAKVALAGATKFKDADNKHIASAIVEVFDRVKRRSNRAARADDGARDRGLCLGASRRR
jgi:hypothetical protein